MLEQTHDMSKIKYVLEAPDHYDFHSICNYFGVVPGKAGNSLKSENGSNLDLLFGESLSSIHWNAELAIKHEIKSTYGLLVTTRGRVFRVVTDSYGRVMFNTMIIGPIRAGLELVELQKITKDLSEWNVFDPYNQVKIQTLQTQIRKLSEKTKTLHYEFSDIILPMDVSFEEACQKLSLAENGEHLFILNGETSTNLILDYLRNEVPIARIAKPGTKDLLVTNKGRLIWCEKTAYAYCIDYPFGKGKTLTKDFLQDAINKYLKFSSTYEIHAFCCAVKNFI